MLTTPTPLTPADQADLLDLAEVSVRACLRGVRYPGPDVAALTPALEQPCTAFVVVRLGADVFGCAGSTEPRPLASCVPDLALRAAFEVRSDRRLTDDDLRYVDLVVSVVRERRPVSAGSRVELLRRLDPDRHGLSISVGDHRATLLPSAWAQRPDPGDFLDTILRRAGLDPTSWPDDLRAELISTWDFDRLLE